MKTFSTHLSNIVSRFGDDVRATHQLIEHRPEAETILDIASKIEIVLHPMAW